jgi:hypothetical protein
MPPIVSSPSFGRHFLIDNSLIDLLKEIPIEATLKPDVEVTVQHVCKVKFTIMNHTNQSISIGTGINLLIDNISVRSFPSNIQFCHIIAYHLEDQPEMICVNFKCEKDKYVPPILFYGLVWQELRPNQLPIPAISCAATSSTAMRNIDINRIANKKLDLFPKSYEGWFLHCDESLKNNFILIMQSISPHAILSNQHTWVEKNSNDRKIRILNFTKHTFDYDDEGCFYVDEQHTELDKGFMDKDCCCMAYHVTWHPEVICLEVKFDHHEFVSDRLFLTHVGNEWRLKQAIHDDRVKQDRFANLFGLQATESEDCSQFLNSNEGYIYLLKKIREEFILLDAPQIAFWQARTVFPRVLNLIAVNHTNQHIAFDVTGRLRINDKVINDSAFSVHSQIVAIHPIDNPQMICINATSKNSKHVILRVNLQLTWRCIDESKVIPIFENVRKERAFKVLWAGYHDPNSSLFKLVSLPPEILSIILNLYIDHAIKVKKQHAIKNAFSSEPPAEPNEDSMHFTQSILKVAVIGITCIGLWYSIIRK